MKYFKTNEQLSRKTKYLYRMTTHYSIEITDTQTHLKVTYKNKKFRKLEHLRGEILEMRFKSIGKIIPLKESQFDAFIKEWKGKINYTLITEEKSLFSLFNSEWHSFYENFSGGIPPKFTATDGKCLKGIISHFQRISTTDSEALDLWKLMLDKWTTVSEFHQKNTDLKYINSKLNILLNEIKRTNDTQRSVKSASSSEVGKHFKFS